MKRLPLLLCAIGLNLGLTIVTGCHTAAPEVVAQAASVPLADTSWRLVRLEGQILENPPGERALNLQLLSQNPRVTGFAGCNRFFGGYLLDGDQLRFDQLGATKMACTDDARMQREQRFFAVLARVEGWRIADRSLELRDAAGAVVALFLAEAAASP